MHGTARRYLDLSALLAMPKRVADCCRGKRESSLKMCNLFIGLPSERRCSSLANDGTRLRHQHIVDRLPFVWWKCLRDLLLISKSRTHQIWFIAGLPSTAHKIWIKCVVCLVVQKIKMKTTAQTKKKKERKRIVRLSFRYLVAYLRRFLPTLRVLLRLHVIQFRVLFSKFCEIPS